MPRSKHRRKPGGKAVRHPGRGTQFRAREPEPTPAELAYAEFTDRLWDAFDARFAHISHASLMLEIIGDATFDPDTMQPKPVSREVVLTEFVSGGGTLTAEQAAAALTLLTDQGLIAINDDQITVSDSVWPEKQPESVAAGTP